MATYIQTNRVLYESFAGSKWPISRLYFCRHCLKLRCSDSVSHEVDSHYCPNCLENMPSAEAKLKKNRCANCFDCPSCKHTLSTRATSMAVPHPDDPKKSTPKKVYYLACGFCRWTSRDVGMKDQSVASGGWQDQENPHLKRIQALLEYYRQLATKEKMEKERKKYTRRRSYLHFSDKYGLTPLAARRSTLMGMGSLSLKETEELKVPEITMSEASSEVEPLPESYFTQPVNLAKVTSMSQRLSSPEFQPTTTESLYPLHKHLLIKRSQRCKECEHNLSKSEFNPSSIKFKIQLVALHHVPEIRIQHIPRLLNQKEVPIVLTLYNPVEYIRHVTLLPFCKEDDFATAKVEVPMCELMMGPQDDTAEYDETSDANMDFKDDADVMVFRKANKIGFNIKVTPQSDKGEVKISFLMKYDFRNTSTTLQAEEKEPQMVWLEHPVHINLGHVSPAGAK